MSDVYKGLEDLRVNPFRPTKLEPTAVAEFNCPICGERIKMMFTEKDLKQLRRGIKDAISARAMAQTRRPSP